MNNPTYYLLSRCGNACWIKINAIVHAENGLAVEVDETFLTVHSVLYDALFVVGGEVDNPNKFKSDMMNFINEAFQHFKPIGVAATGTSFFEPSEAKTGPGIVMASESSDFNKDFITAVAAHRHWDRKIYG